MHKIAEYEDCRKEMISFHKVCLDEDPQPNVRTKSVLQHTDNDSGDEASGSSSVASFDFHANLRIRSQRARNVTEKKRRDKLNMYIDQLAALLPQDGSHKMDKSSVLSQTVNYLKWRNKTSTWCGNDKYGSSKCFFSAEDLGLLMQELMNGCLISLDQNGKLTYVADLFKNLMDECRDVLGEPLAALIHPEDVNAVLNEIKKQTDMTNNAILQNKDEPETKKNPVEFCFRSSKKKDTVDDLELCCSGFWSEKQSQESNDDGSEKYLDILLWPKMNINVVDKNSKIHPPSFSTQLGMDGKFLLIDASCTQVIGYLPYELLNTSLYFYLHENDLEDVVKLHKALMSSSDPCPVMAFFRFRSKNDDWPLLKAILKVTFNPMTEKSEYIHSHFALAGQTETLQYSKLKASSPGKISRGFSAANRSTMNRSESQSLKDKQMHMEGNVPPWQIERRKVNRVSSESVTVSKNSQLTADSPSNPNVTRKGSSEESQKTSKVSEAENDIEGSLQIQLKKKLETLTTSISEQKDRLKLIFEIMQNIRHEMNASENMQIQQNYQNQIYEQLKNNIEEQEKQCHKLRIILDGKIKVSETKRIVMELREKSKLLKTAAETSEKTRLKPSKNTSRQSPYQQSSVSPVPSRDNQRVSQSYARTESLTQSSSSYVRTHSPIQASSSYVRTEGPSQSSTSYVRPDNQAQSSSTYRENSILKRSFQGEQENRAKISCTTERQEQNSQTSNSSQQEQSLQRQLQQLQHQQEVLNAQGMALATQGSIPSSQIELLQLLLRHQQGKSSQDQEQSEPSSSRSSATLPSRYQPSYNKNSTDTTDGQQAGSAYSMLNTMLQQIFAENNLKLQKSADGSLSSGDLDNPLSQEILVQLQRLQMQLQVQMQMLGSQHQNDDQQRQSIAGVVSALQQLQQMQLGLLQRKINTNNTAQSPQMNARSESRSNLLSVGDNPSDYLQSSPMESAVRFQYPQNDPGSSFMSAGFPQSSTPRQCNMEQGQPSQFRVPPSPSGSYCSGQYNISRSPRQPSPRSTSAEYQIGNSYARNDQGMPINSPILSNSPYRRCSSSDNMESFMSMSPGANMSNPNDLMRNVPDASHNNNHDANRSAEKKEKKLEEDSLYDYIQTLPGQTQQLMQLHHAQRVHIIRMQHQQLQALQHHPLSQQEEQQQQQQQQQQRSFTSMQRESDPRVQNDCNLASVNMQPDTQSHASFESAHASCSNPHSSGTQATGSQDNWQNDLQADQVVAMSDFDLLELLNGQHAFEFDEEDEKVLDLLIAEGGDTFSV